MNQVQEIAAGFLASRQSIADSLRVGRGGVPDSQIPTTLVPSQEIPLQAIPATDIVLPSAIPLPEPPLDDDLERSSRTLAGELVKDAMGQLRAAQGGEMDESKALGKRKYAVAVMQHVTKGVQGKEALKLKRQQEGRENAGFLMDLMARAQAGTITEQELSLLEAHTERNQTEE